MSIQELQDKLQRHDHYLEQDKTNAHLIHSIGLLNAQILHHQHQLDDAIGLLKDLALNYPACANIEGLLALLYFDKNDAINAKAHAKKAMALDANQYEGQLVDMLLRAVRQETTLAEIELLLNINPGDCRLWYAKGTLLLRTMNITGAEDAFLQASLIWPAFYDNWIALGWCYLLQNKINPAMDAYRHATSIDTDAADGWGGRALVCALNKERDETDQFLQKAEQIDAGCFLAAVTRLIIKNAKNDDGIAMQFNNIFPEAAFEINKILSQKNVH